MTIQSKFFDDYEELISKRNRANSEPTSPNWHTCRGIPFESGKLPSNQHNSDQVADFLRQKEEPILADIWETAQKLGLSESREDKPKLRIDPYTYPVF